MKDVAAPGSFFRPARDSGWRIESAVRAIAGTIIIIGLGLSLLDHRWLWLVAFVGVNLFQSGLTGWCLMSDLLAGIARNRAA